MPRSVQAAVKWHCRCRKCSARQVKARHPDDYCRPPRCRKCKAVGSLLVNAWANRRPWRALTCNCDGYWFPHKRGTGSCIYNEKLYDDPQP